MPLFWAQIPFVGEDDFSVVLKLRFSVMIIPRSFEENAVGDDSESVSVISRCLLLREPHDL